MKNLVMFNMSYRSDWEDGLLNRNYFILRELISSGRFDKILSVDFLPFSLKKVAKVMVQQQPFRKNAQTVLQKMTLRVDHDGEHENLYHMSATSRKNLSEVLHHLDMQVVETVMWNYTPFEADVMLAYPDATHVFDAVDNWSEHSVYSSRKEELRRHYHTITQHADAIFTVSPKLVELLGEKALCIPNGVDESIFAQFTPIDKNAESLVIGYHGNIQSRFNFALLAKLAALQPKNRFEIYGGVWKEVQEKADSVERDHENVTFHGRFRYADLPKILSTWDIAMIPHRQDALTESMNPMKVYEYLAAGVPIVATEVVGTEYMITPPDAEGFASAIESIQHGAADTITLAGQSAMKEHTWKARVEEMLKQLA